MVHAHALAERQELCNVEVEIAANLHLKLVGDYQIQACY